ncbi:MAG: hypothetical protein HFG26_00595 [Provencibacterium sp.]|jgi:hypothetical protein|nr:hypothetical protein [Provencibacterium sp.]
MKRIGRKIGSLLLVLSLALGLAPGVQAQSSEMTIGDSGIMARGTPDSTPPEIVSYSVDKTQVEPGG